MSSACVCHTGEWCFYCEMYSPLERKYEQQTQAIERVITELISEQFQTCNSDYGNGYWYGVDSAITKLKAVLEHGTQVRSEENDH